MNTMSSTIKLNGQWEGGKGSKRRGGSDELYQSNWDRIFGGIDYAMVPHDGDKVDKEIEKDLQKDNG